MGFKEVETSLPEAWKTKKAGESLTGTYSGSEQVTLKGKKPFTTHIITLDDGKRHSVAGAMLDRAFLRVPRGAKVRVTYEGMGATAEGNRLHKFKLEVDESVALLDAAGAFDPTTGELRA